MLSRLIPDNPVLTKELRVRMRGSRAYWILFGYLGFLSFVLLGGYYIWQSGIHNQGAGSSDVAGFGASIFSELIVTQMFLVVFITPAITSGSLTIEKEQRTLEMLTMTRMPRRSIIAGKLLSAVLFTSLLLISSLPLISICFMLGSIDPGMVFSTYVEMLFGSFLIGAMGLMWSSIAKSTTLAVLFTYASLMVVFMFGAYGYHVGTAAFASGTGTAALWAIADSLLGSSFLGLHCFDGAGFVVIAFVAGVLMSAIAMSRLEMFPERKASLLRCLTALLCGLVVFAANNYWLQGWYHRGGTSVMRVAQPPIGALMVTAALLMLLVPTFATGELLPYEVRRYGGYLRSGWTAAGLRRGKLASGIPYLLLVTVLLLALYAFSFVVNGKRGDITRSAALPSPTGSAPQPLAPGILAVNGSTVAGSRAMVMLNGQAHQYVMANGRLTLMPILTHAKFAGPPPGYQQQVGDFPQAAVMLLAFVLGFSLLCLLISVICRNRWFAWAAAIVFLIILWIAPEQAKAPIYVGLAPEPTIYVYYLNPEEALLQMSDPNVFWTSNKGLAYARQPIWLRVTQTWTVIGGLSLLLTLPLVRRQSKQSIELPYEALVADA